MMRRQVRAEGLLRARMTMRSTQLFGEQNPTYLVRYRHKATFRGNALLASNQREAVIKSMLFSPSIHPKSGHAIQALS